jgi:hypothetical protein
MLRSMNKCIQLDLKLPHRITDSKTSEAGYIKRIPAQGRSRAGTIYLPRFVGWKILTVGGTGDDKKDFDTIPCGYVFNAFMGLGEFVSV